MERLWPDILGELTCKNDTTYIMSFFNVSGKTHSFDADTTYIFDCLSEADHAPFHVKATTWPPPPHLYNPK